MTSPPIPRPKPGVDLVTRHLLYAVEHAISRHGDPVFAYDAGRSGEHADVIAALEKRLPNAREIVIRRILDIDAMPAPPKSAFVEQLVELKKAVESTTPSPSPAPNPAASSQPARRAPPPPPGIRRPPPEPVQTTPAAPPIPVPRPPAPTNSVMRRPPPAPAPRPTVDKKAANDALIDDIPF